MGCKQGMAKRYVATVQLLLNYILVYSRASIIRTPLVQKPFGYVNSSDN